MVGGWRVGDALSSVSVGLWLLPRRGKGLATGLGGAQRPSPLGGAVPAQQSDY